MWGGIGVIQRLFSVHRVKRRSWFIAMDGFPQNISYKANKMKALLQGFLVGLVLLSIGFCAIIRENGGFDNFIQNNFKEAAK